jgi:acylglycerol lipase
MDLMSFTASPCAVEFPDPKALVVFCHGFLDSATWYKGCMYRQKLLDAGYIMCALEAEGHGRSDGLNGLIKNWSEVIKDFADFTRHTLETLPADKPPPKVFLVGESMGGAVALDLSHQFPELFDGGAILVAPMVGIHGDVKPPPAVLKLFRFLSDFDFIGALPFAPTADQGEVYYKLPHLREVALSAPSNYGRKPRLASARELLNTTERILADVLPHYERPFLVLHGEDDRVTDPEFSKALFENAISKDKTMKVYAGGWHALTTGEPSEVSDVVFDDMLEWMDDRC